MGPPREEFDLETCYFTQPQEIIQNALLRLEQIVALKFLGLSLQEIGDILKSPALTVKKSLKVQAGIITEEVRRLEAAARALGQVLAQLGTGKKVNFKKVITIIMEIQMSEEKKRSWAERFYTPEELEEFEEIGNLYTPEQMEAYQKKWADLIEQVKRSLVANPAGPVGQDLARRWQALLDEAYGGHPELKKRIGEAYASDAVPAEYQMITPEVWEFMSKARSALRKESK